MKYIVIFLLFVASSWAQEIKGEQLSVEDALRYLGVDPRDVGSTKFTATFSSPKFAKLWFQKTVAGKVTATHWLPLGPSSSFGVEVFLTPLDQKSGTRDLHFKLSTPTAGMSSVQRIDCTVPGTFKTYEYMIGREVPLVFSCTSGDTRFTLTFTSSDAPEKK
jgi:hypothetical protein